MIIGIDLGNKSRNSIALMDGDKLIEWSRLNYNDSQTPYHHRQKICKQIKNYIKKYNLTKNDYLIFEEIAFYPGKSRMYNIVSMAFLQATIINEFSDKISICTVHVQSWKSKVLGNRKATKEDTVQFVETHYPEVDLNIIKTYKRKADEIIKDNDTADAICIGIFGNMVEKEWFDKHLVNYM